MLLDADVGSLALEYLQVRHGRTTQKKRFQHKTAGRPASFRLHTAQLPSVPCVRQPLPYSRT